MTNQKNLFWKRSNLYSNPYNPGSHRVTPTDYGEFPDIDHFDSYIAHQRDKATRNSWEKFKRERPNAAKLLQEIFRGDALHVHHHFPDEITETKAGLMLTLLQGSATGEDEDRCVRSLLSHIEDIA